MFRHLLNSEALDLAESLAHDQCNPWAKLTAEEQGAIKLEIYKSLKKIHLQDFEAAENNSFRALRKLSLIQYVIYVAGFSLWLTLGGADLNVLWSVFLFYAPVIVLCINYFLTPLSPAIVNKRALVKDLNEASEVGLQRFLLALEELKYSSSPNSSDPKPNADLKEITPEQAEEFCAAWLRNLGFLDASVTRYSRDGGIDVESQYLCAQVKHQTSPVGVKAVRELYGVAVHAKKTPIFFALSDYTQEAKAFATNVNMPIIRYHSNSLVPMNQPGELFVSQGPRFIHRSAR